MDIYRTSISYPLRRNVKQDLAAKTIQDSEVVRKELSLF
jgi:hypothetical protein